MRPVRILIANPHAATRAGVCRALENHGFAIVGEAASAAAAVELAIREQPDLCLLAVQMDGGGIRAAEEITAQLPGSAVVMLTVSTDEADLLDSLRAGAVGYLLMDTDAARLPHALHGVMAGEAAIPRQLLPRVIDELRYQGRRRRIATSTRPAVTVTRREWEVLGLMREGLSTADVAKRLVVSPVTVRRHASSATRKLGLGDRAATLRLLDAQA